jgi:hypothetical protein
MLYSHSTLPVSPSDRSRARPTRVPLIAFFTTCRASILLLIAYTMGRTHLARFRSKSLLWGIEADFE